MKNSSKLSKFIQLTCLFLSFPVSFYFVFPARLLVLAQDSSPQLWHSFFQKSELLAEQNEAQNKEPTEPPTEPKPKRGTNGGSRGDGICPIAPNYSDTLRVWSVRPTFTWEGKITKL